MNANHTILFLSHGGGPMPLLGDKAHKEMVICLEEIAQKIAKPKAILVISAHWEEPIATLTAGAQPELIYDYYGFPEESYSIQYPCPGEPKLAQKVYQALSQAGLKTQLDEQRGYDHGLFVPLKIMYPEADIPCVQLSLVNNLNPDLHLDIGYALKDLDYEDLLIIGSGFSFHNMKAFFDRDNDDSRAMNEAFDQWLINTCTDTELSEEIRAKKLAQWELAPYARYCHPREEHLIPLHLCYGMAQKAATEVFELDILHKKASMYLWQ